MSSPLRLALIGCGAIAQSHARAIAALPSARLTAVVDVEVARARAFQQAHAPGALVLEGAGDLARLAEHADAAVVCTPNREHAPQTSALLDAGLHVLCEKPLALGRHEAEALIERAARSGRMLACGLVRRFYGNTTLVSRVLREQLLGPVRRVEVRESVLNWPFSRASFDREISGGGVLVDMAPHVLDLLALWLGPLQLLGSQTDEEGGVEAVAELTLEARVAGQAVPVHVQLCRVHGLRTETVLHCERGLLRLSPHRSGELEILFHGADGSPLRTTATAEGGDPFVSQMRNFVAAIQGSEPLVAPGREAAASVALIEEAYGSRLPRPTPSGSHPVTAVASRHDWPFRRVLVTGATGSVGSRLVELWTARGLGERMRCLMRSHAHAARLLRLPVNLALGDLTDVAAVQRAAEGCDAIVHLGVGEKAALETASVLAAARHHRIQRLVHMSSAAVYGIRMPAAIEVRQDQTPVEPTGEPYADAKAAAEQLVRDRGAPPEVVILRPHIVYGPGLRWSSEPLELLRRGQLPVVEGGGHCNLIHVDDLVGAVDAALAATRGFGEPLFVTDGRPRSWEDYVLAHARLIGVEPPRVSRQSVDRGQVTWKSYLADSVRPVAPLIRSREFRSLVMDSPLVRDTVFRAYLAARGAPSLRPLIERVRGSGGGGPAAAADRAYDAHWTELQLAEARLSSARAELLIGFRAQISFEEGLRGLESYFERFAIGRH